MAGKTEKSQYVLAWEFVAKGGNSFLSTLGKVDKMISGVSNRLFNMGVTTIFVDRLMQSFVRAWKLLNEVVGAARLGEQANAFQRISEMSGIALDKLQAFTHGVRIVGAEMEDVSDLFQTVAERVDDIRKDPGSGIGKDFASFGITSRDFNGLTSALDMVLVITDRIQHLTGDRRLAFLEKALGGDLARKFGQTMTKGSQGLIDLMQEAIDAGAVLSAQEIQMAKDYWTAQQRVQRGLMLVSNALGAVIMPYLNRVWNIVGRIAERTARFLRMYSGLKSTLNTFITPFLDRIENGLEVWDRYFKDIGETVYRIGRGFAFAFGASQIKTILGLAATGRSLMEIFKEAALWIDDFITFMFDRNPRNSIIGTFIRDSPILMEVMGGIWAAIGRIRMGFKAIAVAWQIFVNGPLLPMTMRFGLWLLSSASKLIHWAGIGLAVLTAATSMMAELYQSLKNMGKIWKDVSSRFHHAPSTGIPMGVIGDILRTTVDAGMGDVSRYNAKAFGDRRLGMGGDGAWNKDPQTTVNYWHTGSPATGNNQLTPRQRGGMVRP